MKKQKVLILTLIVLSFKMTMAQQLPNANYFMYDHARTNPGSLGSKDMVCASLIFRESMMGIEGAPQNVMANIETPFNLFGLKHGVGLSLNTDNVGFNEDITIRLGYALRLNVGEGTLGIGVNGNLNQHNLNAEWIDPSGGQGEEDAYIPSGNQEDLQGFGLGVGLFYRSEDIYLGASIANVYASDIEFESGGTTTANSAVLVLRPHYYLTAGYTYQLSNPAYEIEPSLMLFSDGVSTSFDLNGTLTYNKRVWGGVTYRAGSPVASAVVGMLGFVVLDGLQVGGAYEYNTSALSSYSSGGFEVLLNYCFKLGVEKSPKRYRSIRYL